MCVSHLRAYVRAGLNCTMPALPSNADNEWCSDIGGRSAELIKQRLEHRAVVEHDVGAKALVCAVFAPGLRERLKLGVGRNATSGCEVVTNYVQFGEVEGETTLRTELSEAVIRER